jgi:hypothetical protein
LIQRVVGLLKGEKKWKKTINLEVRDKKLSDYLSLYYMIIRYRFDTAEAHE